MSTVKLVISFFLAFFQVLAPIAGYVANGGEDRFFTEWSVSDTFDKDDYIELKKTPGEDFKILNLADVQLKDDLMYTVTGDCSMKLIDELVTDHDPDLITLSGDNAWGTMAYIELFRQLDSYAIPWAPVMGNHDGQATIGEFWAAYLMYKSEYSLFRFGPKDMGYGNYIINITENGRIIHTLFMMDTHDSATYTLEDGSTVSGYDHLWKNQMDWYKWAVEGIAEIEGHTVESTVIMHIPVVEYADAWNEVKIESDNAEEIHGKINPDFSAFASGRRFEDVCSAPVNNGFFELCREVGSTKNILVGHDHVNDFSILYKGITLSYAVKTGLGAYYRNDMIGGTTVTVNSQGNAKIQQHYYDPAEYGYDV